MSSLRVVDPAAVRSLYASLFGWQDDESGAATLFGLAGYARGGPESTSPRDVVAVMEQAGGAADAGWTPGFWVVDAAAAAEMATPEGGRLVSGREVTGTGYLAAVLLDPKARGSPSASCRAATASALLGSCPW